MMKTLHPKIEDFLKNPIGDRPIVFFDGDCVMCNGFVDLLTQIDPANTIFIATLQGKTAQKYLPTLPQNPDKWSIFYLEYNSLYSQTDALIQLSQHLGRPWSFFSIIRIIPIFIRNKLYRFIARNRYRWFGSLSTCRIPTEEETKRFLP